LLRLRLRLRFRLRLCSLLLLLLLVALGFLTVLGDLAGCFFLPAMRTVSPFWTASAGAGLGAVASEYEACGSDCG
jgi:hypothetical protein